MRSGQVRSGQVSSSQVRSGQVRSDQVRSDQISSGQVRSDRVTRFLWFLGRAARRKFCFCNPSARSAEKNFATLDQVTRFLWYLEMLGQHWVSADGKKHEGRAIHLQKKQWSSEDKLAKSIFRYFFCKNPITEPTFFLYIKLLISLLNGAFFRLGKNFLVRGHGAKFSATPQQQLL